MPFRSSVRRILLSAAGYGALAVAPLGLGAEEVAINQAMIVASEGVAAADERDYPTFLRKMEEAVAIRPDVPRLLAGLAAAQALNGREGEAIATLERIAALGLHAGIENDEDLATLGEREDFKELVKTFSANLRPTGSGEVAFSLRDMTGLIEGIAWREKTGEFFFGDVNGRAIWVRSADGRTVRKFTDDDEAILAVLSLAVDEANGVLWAAMGAVPPMRGYAPDIEETAGLGEFDLASGKLRRVVPVPGDGLPHVLRAIALAPDGTVYATDSATPLVWQLPPGGRALDVVAESPEFFSLQGIAVANGGLLVADRINGLLHVDLRGGDVRRLDADGATLIGIAGLTLAPNGDVIAVQNATMPKRVLRIILERGGAALGSVQVIDSGHLVVGDPSQGCIGPGGDFFFIANTGWVRFGSKSEPGEPRPVAVFRSKL
jgi:sugar lactone lactonase YvrE